MEGYKVSTESLMLIGVCPGLIFVKNNYSDPNDKHESFDTKVDKKLFLQKQENHYCYEIENRCVHTHLKKNDGF